MALSPDQRAMLQLLLARRQSYGDIADLLGTDAEDVRSRSRNALEELAGADPDSEVGLTDYLLGQADPIARADAVRHLQRDPGAHALAEGLLAQLQLIAPEAELPALPALREGRRPGAASPVSRTPGTGGWSSMPPERARLIVALVAAAAIAVMATLIVISNNGGDDNNGGSAATSTGTGTDQTLPAIKLKAIGNGPSGASGTARFGTSQGQAFVQIEADGLAPSAAGEYYVVWLYSDPTYATPLAAGEKVTKSGKLTGFAVIRTQVLPILTTFRSIDVSIEKSRRPARHRGPSVLRGSIPGGGRPLESVTGTGTSTSSTNPTPTPTPTP